MNRTLIKPLLVAVALLMASGPSQAQEAPTQASPESKPKPPAKPKTPAKPKASAAPSQDKADLDPMIAAQSKARSKALKAQKHAPVPKGKVLDLNSASKEELKLLPGITDAIADKIIAGRPYRTKAHLLTRDVVTYSVYTAIKKLVVAQQPKVPAR